MNKLCLNCDLIVEVCCTGLICSKMYASTMQLQDNKVGKQAIGVMAYITV